MNFLIEKGCVQEMTCGGNLAYVLNDNSSFLPTEYKVLQNQTDSCFVKCMKMLYNGKVQLYYVTQGLKSFASLIPHLDADGFMIIASNLISNIVDVKHNGFLSCKNIDISLEHIYVDLTTYKVSLVYLPLNISSYEDEDAFENELRTQLIKLISGVMELSSPKTIQFSVDLSNGTLKLEDLQNRNKGGEILKVKPILENIQQKEIEKHLRLVAMNAPSRVEIAVTKDEFLIGRNAASVDGVISFNKMIGRVHCKITRNGDQFTITDLQSSNGTYVNKLRLMPQQPQYISHGDIVRLANSDFQVCIK